MKENFADWLNEAIKAIRCGVADKLTRNNVTVYKVKNIIRIDIKED